MQGLDVFLFEYRGYGYSEGSPDLEKILHDVEALPSFLESLGYSKDQLYAYGRSLGSIYAIHFCHILGSEHKGGLIIDSGMASPFEWASLRSSDSIPYLVESGKISMEEAKAFQASMENGEMKKAFDEKLDNIAKIRKFHGFLLLLHTKDDKSFPPADPEALFQEAGCPEENKFLKIFDEGGHNHIFLFNKDEYLSLVLEFLKRSGVGPGQPAKRKCVIL